MQDQILTDKGISYTRIQYAKPLCTVSEVASAEQIRPEQVIKAMGVYVENEPAIVLILGNVRLDTRVLEQCLGRRVRLVRTREFQDVFGVPVGALSPLICATRGIPLYIEEQVLEQNEVSISSGDPSEGIRLQASSLRLMASSTHVVSITSKKREATLHDPQQRHI